MRHPAPLSLALLLMSACSLAGGPAPTSAPLAAAQPIPAPSHDTDIEQVAYDLAVTPTSDAIEAAPPIDAAPVSSAAVSKDVMEPVDAAHTVYALRRGETLAHFARWSGRTVEEVADSSELDLDGLYDVGTEVALSLTAGERARVEQQRDAHHQRRARSYLDSRGATQTTFYTVRTGDTAWAIAQGQLGMPVWLLESLNPSTALDRLRPGQELLVPVFSDVVVEAPTEADE